MTDPISPSVREATSNDLAFLAEAHRSGHNAIVDQRGGTLDIALRGRSEPIEDSFAASLDDALTTVLVGEVDKIAVGYLTITIEALPTKENLGRVTDLWVHPHARGVGLGAALMRSAVNFALAHDCSGIDARALPGDRITKNFFESFGLVARTIEVYKAL